MPLMKEAHSREWADYRRAVADATALLEREGGCDAALPQVNHARAALKAAWVSTAGPGAGETDFARQLADEVAAEAAETAASQAARHPR